MPLILKKPKFHTLNHNCQLPEDGESLLPANLLRKGLIGKIQKRIYPWFLLSPNDHMVQKLFPTEKAYIEARNHQFHYWFNIHPFSKFTFYWQLLIAIIFSLNIFMDFSISSKYEEYEKSKYIYAEYFVTLMSCVDILLTLLTGWYHRITNTIIFKKTIVFRKVLKSKYTWIRIVYTVFVNFSWSYYGNDIIAMFRIIISIRYTDRSLNKLGFDLYTIAIFLFFFAMVLLCASWTNVIMNVLSFDSFDTPKNLSRTEEFFNEKLKSLFGAAAMFTYSWYPPYVNLDDFTKVAIVYAILFFSFCVHICITAYMLMFVLEGHKIKDNYLAIIQQLKQYFQYKDMPFSMQAKIKSYYEFNYKKNYFTKIHLDILPDSVKNEMLLQTTGNLLSAVPVLKHATLEVLLELSKCLATHIYQRGDIVVKVGSQVTGMFFIQSGSVAVFDQNGMKINQLEDGAFFGEIALMTKSNKRIVTISTLETTILFKLSTHDFNRVILQHPHLYYSIRKIAYRRLKLLLRRNSVPMDASFRSLLNSIITDSGAS